MDGIVPFVPIALLALACPLVMGAMGLGAWFLAKAKGENKPLSIGCMMGRCQHEEHGAKDQSGLKEQVSRLEHQVQTLRAQVAPHGIGVHIATPAEEVAATAGPSDVENRSHPELRPRRRSISEALK